MQTQNTRVLGATPQYMYLPAPTYGAMCALWALAPVALCYHLHMHTPATLAPALANLAYHTGNPLALRCLLAGGY